MTSTIARRSFTTERRSPHSARQILAAFAEAELERQWFANPGNWPHAVWELGG